MTNYKLNKIIDDAITRIVLSELNKKCKYTLKSNEDSDFKRMCIAQLVAKSLEKIA